MSLLEQGCDCEKCLGNTAKLLDEARVKWENGVREIVFKSYSYYCGDGCCSYDGTNVFVNGFHLDSDGENAESVTKRLMEFLGVENVKIDFEYDEE